MRAQLAILDEMESPAGDAIWEMQLVDGNRRLALQVLDREAKAFRGFAPLGPLAFLFEAHAKRNGDEWATGVRLYFEALADALCTIRERAPG